MEIDYLDFNKDAIQEGFNRGREEVTKFIETYL